MKTGFLSKINNTPDMYLAGIIISVCLLCYVNSLHNPFIWDQEVVIAGNPLIRSWKNVPYVFKTNVEGRRLVSISFYRPMEVISYMVDYTFWKLEPFGYHCSSILLHLCNSLLFFLLLKKIKIEKYIAFISSFIFAIHPVNAESVTYSIRGDLLGVLFFILSLLFFIYSESGKKIFIFLSISMYLLALLSKESTVVALFIILIYVMLLRPRTKPKEIQNPTSSRVISRVTKRNLLMNFRPLSNLQSICKRFGIDKSKNLYFLTTFLLISALYIFIRMKLIFTSNYTPLSLIADAPSWQRILTLPKILLTYLSLLLIPVHLHMEYLFVVRNPTEVSVWLGVPFLGTVSYHFLKYIKCLSGDDVRLKRYLLFFLGWFLIGLVPFYNIIVPLHATLTEHWLYLPGMGFIVFITLFVSHIFKKITNKKLARVVTLSLLFLLCYYAIITIRRNFEWRDPLTLYQHDLRYEPNSFILHNNVGVIKFREGDLKKAKDSFLKAIQVSPRQKYEVAYNNLGVVFENEGNLGKAEESYKRSIQLNNYELAFGNLARLYLKKGRANESISVSLEGQRLYPLNPEINYNLGQGYYLIGQYGLAKSFFEYIQKNIDPDYRDINNYLDKLKTFVTGARQ